ncbi:hypothetical protein EV182_006590, partial [Spiromyces aspiralis]
MLELVFKSVGAPPIGLNDYRHVAIALMEKNIRGMSTLLDPGDLLDEQAAHTHQTAVAVYARSQYDMRYITRDSAQEFFRCSIRWHELLGVSDHHHHQGQGQQHQHPHQHYQHQHQQQSTFDCLPPAEPALPSQPLPPTPKTLGKMF